MRLIIMISLLLFSCIEKPPEKKDDPSPPTPPQEEVIAVEVIATKSGDGYILNFVSEKHENAEFLSLKLDGVYQGIFSISENVFTPPVTRDFIMISVQLMDGTGIPLGDEEDVVLSLGG